MLFSKTKEGAWCVVAREVDYISRKGFVFLMIIRTVSFLVKSECSVLHML